MGEQSNERVVASLSRNLPPDDPEDPDPSFPSPKRPTSETGTREVLEGIAAETGGEPHVEERFPEGAYVDEDSTDAVFDRPLPRYASGRTPEQLREEVDEIIAAHKAGKHPLPAVPPLSEG